MPNNITPAEIIEVEDYEDDEYGPDDFSFVIGPDGELKSFSVPGHLMDEPPEEIKMILALFGIESIHELDHRILH